MVVRGGGAGWEVEVEGKGVTVKRRGDIGILGGGGRKGGSFVYEGWGFGGFLESLVE